MRVQVRFCFLFTLLLLILPYQTSPQTHILTEQKTYNQFNPPIFENITIKDGLPENTALSIFQDYLGYLWFGTQNGFARYDGYTMKVFHPDENKNGNLKWKEVLRIYEDKNKTLWVGTDNGLNKFDRANESFKSYRFNPLDSNSINGYNVLSIYEDKKGRFWVGTCFGLNLFSREKASSARYYFLEGDSISLNKPTLNNWNLCVSAITEDPVSGDLLLGTERDGLWRFNPGTKFFSKYKFNDNKDYDKKIGLIQSFCKAKDGKIWMTSNNTLSCLDPQKKSIKTYIDFPILAKERNTKWGIFSSVIEDKEGLIWCGFFVGEKGAFCLNPKTGELQQYNLFPDKPKKAY